MDRTDPAGGDERPDGEPPTPDPATQARLDRRAEALRANLRRRKAQARGRADAAEPAGSIDTPD